MPRQLQRLPQHHRQHQPRALRRTTVRCEHGNQRHCRRCGLSLIEVSISTLLIGVVLISALKAVGGVFTTWTVAAEQYDGMFLVDQMVDEILQCHYEEPDGAVRVGVEVPETVSSRTDWDDVDDYRAWSASPPVNRDGTPVPATTGWSRSVRVRLVTVLNPASTAVSDEGLKLITVTVTAPDGKSVSRQVLRSKWGMLEQAPLVDSNWVTSVGVNLTTGSGASVNTGVSLPNAAEDF